MSKHYRKYLILAIIGSIIIGLAFYLLLNNYLDKKEIVVASRNINTGEKISEEDLDLKEYYKNSLPENYITNKKDIIGKVINIERRKNDYISMDMFDEKSSSSILDGLSVGDVVIAINVQYIEPILQELESGNYISIVSTVYDKDLIYPGYFEQLSLNNTNYSNQNNPYNYDEEKATDKNKYPFSKGDYIDNTMLSLSKNIILINGQIIVRNLEIIYIEKNIPNTRAILLNNDNNITNIYLKCDIKEAPIIARLTKDKNYKIIVEEI